jgi:hypothetical protein
LDCLDKARQHEKITGSKQISRIRNPAGEAHAFQDIKLACQLMKRVSFLSVASNQKKLVGSGLQSTERTHEGITRFSGASRPSEEVNMPFPCGCSVIEIIFSGNAHEREKGMPPGIGEGGSHALRRGDIIGDLAHRPF